jgi:hypothetical protein
MFSKTVNSVNGNGYSLNKVAPVENVNKVAPGHTKGGSFWERLTGQR